MERIESTIRTAATRRLGVADVLIVRVDDTPKFSKPESWQGEWFGLSLLVDGEWKFVGRRRTRLELLTLANELRPEDIEGKCFRAGV